MMSKTSFTKYFLIAFTLMFISSGLSAGTFGSDGKKKGKEKKEELSADGPYVPVSYTHLDVYKRQVLYKSCTCIHATDIFVITGNHVNT